MNLYFLRHAIAVERGTSGHKDENRPLTKDGIRKMKEGAKGIRSLGQKFDRILTSPLPRARQTADIVCKEFGQEAEVWQSLDPSEDPRQIIAALRKSNARDLLLVGHEPHLSTLVTWLMSGADDSRVELGKGGACLLALDDRPRKGGARLQWLLTPKQLRQLSR